MITVVWVNLGLRTEACAYHLMVECHDNIIWPWYCSHKNTKIVIGHESGHHPDGNNMVFKRTAPSAVSK